MIYVFLADGCEEIEALTPVDVLRRVNLEVKTVSVTNEKLVHGAHGIDIMADVCIDEICDSDFDMLILPGGLPGVDNLEASAELVNMVNKAVAEDKYIAAICAAPRMLGKLNVLNGKKAVCYPGFENELKGALAHDGYVITDGKVITAKGMGVAMDFSLEIVKTLLGEAVANDIKNRMIVK